MAHCSGGLLIFIVFFLLARVLDAAVGTILLTLNRPSRVVVVKVLIFLFAAELDSGATDRLLADLDVPITTILHGQQSFRYHRTACAGDVVTVDSHIADIYDRKNGALGFIVRESRAVNQRDELVAELRTVIVVRQETRA